MVRLPWGSMSQHRTRCPSSAKATGRLSVVVVLATPPFWLANAMTLKVAVTGGSASVGDSYACVFAGMWRIPPRLCESAQPSPATLRRRVRAIRQAADLRDRQRRSGQVHGGDLDGPGRCPPRAAHGGGRAVEPGPGPTAVSPRGGAVQRDRAGRPSVHDLD